jgi:trans-aconitate 2-methyltransferase
MLSSYHWNGKAYDEFSQPQLTAGEELIKLLEIKNEESILDLGCGTGALTIKLACLTPKGNVVGIDISESMIEKAKRKAQGERIKNIHFLQRDILDIDYEEEFEVIFSNSVFNHLTDTKRAFSLVKRALKKGGRFGIQQFGIQQAAHTFITFTLPELREALPQVIQRERFRGYLESGATSSHPHPTVKEYQDLLAETGFREARVFIKEFPHIFKDSTAFIGYVGLMLETLLPEELMGEFSEEVKRMMEAKIGSTNIEVKFSRLFALGIKSC